MSNFQQNKKYGNEYCFGSYFWQIILIKTWNLLMSLIRHRDMTKTIVVFASMSLSLYVFPGMEYQETSVGLTSSPFCYFLWILVTLPIFMFFLNDFSTDSACPTHSQQLMFSQTCEPSSWQTGGGRSNLYQTWYGHQWFFMITTKHGFSLNSGFTKIWSPPNLPLFNFKVSSLLTNKLILSNNSPSPLNGRLC